MENSFRTHETEYPYFMSKERTNQKPLCVFLFLAAPEPET